MPQLNWPPSRYRTNRGSTVCDVLLVDTDLSGSDTDIFNTQSIQRLGIATDSNIQRSSIEVRGIGIRHSSIVIDDDWS